MKINLGDWDHRETREKIEWIRFAFSKDQYRITDEGFIINDFYVTFADEKYATLYYIKYPK